MKTDLQIVSEDNSIITLQISLKYIKINEYYYVECWDCKILISSKTQPNETNSTQVLCPSCAEAIFQEFENY
jgi:Zn finger protein HypA/HybF involved in hydrogenase expression